MLNVRGVVLPDQRTGLETIHDCAGCSRVERIKEAKPTDIYAIRYASEDMAIKDGWVKHYNGRWVCPSCASGDPEEFTFPVICSSSSLAVTIEPSVIRETNRHEDKKLQRMVQEIMTIWGNKVEELMTEVLSARGVETSECSIQVSQDNKHTLWHKGIPLASYTPPRLLAPGPTTAHADISFKFYAGMPLDVVKNDGIA